MTSATGEARAGAILCRLCGASAERVFTTTVLNRYDVGFFRCGGCESLQTEEPHWLDEAYRDQRRFFDTGAASRNVRLQMLMFWAVRLLRVSPSARVLDWGGGDGLLVRLLRDVGFDAYHWDKYARNQYAAGFEAEAAQGFDIVTAFEVWEHLPYPREEVERIFAAEPEVHMLSTSLYEGQGEDWDYLYPMTGRHVFFFSRTAMEQIAEQYGYRVMNCPAGITLFVRRPVPAFTRWLLERLFSPRWERAVRLGFAIWPKHCRIADDRRLLQARAATLHSEEPQDGLSTIRRPQTRRSDESHHSDSP